MMAKKNAVQALSTRMRTLAFLIRGSGPLTKMLLRRRGMSKGEATRSMGVDMEEGY
jgi:hypothetical protein